MFNSTTQNLTQSSVTALKWNYLGVMTRTMSGLVIGVVLARILGPEPFGQVAVATLVISLANLIADFGFGSALVQREALDDTEVRFVFTVQLSLGLLLCGIIVVAAGPISAAFNSPDTKQVVRALAPMFVLQAAGQTAASLLKRTLEFRKIQTAQISSYLSAYLLLGIPLALLGFGVWSLVIAQLFQTLAYSLWVYWKVRHPTMPILRGGSRSLLGFGTKVIGTNLSNWVTSNIDNVIVGRVFGVSDLGLYNRAFLLTVTPMNGVVATLQGVLFPSYSRAQDRPDTLRRTYLASLSIVSMLVFPLFGSMALVPHTIVVGLYGEKWASSVPLLSPLAIAMTFHAVMALAGPLLWGIGKVELELRAQFVVAAVIVPALLAAALISLPAVAWAVCMVYAVRFALVTQATVKVLDIRWSDIVRSLSGAGLIAALTAASVKLCDVITGRLGVTDLGRLAADGGVGFFSLLALICVFRGTIWQPESVWFWNRVIPRLPHWAGRLVPKTVGVDL